MQKGITLVHVLIIVAVIAGISILSGLGYIAYQNFFGEQKLAAKYYTSQEDCENAGYYWYNNNCQEEKGSGDKQDSGEEIEQSQVKDCGVSKSLASKDAFNKDPEYLEGDDTLVCLGEHILNDCSKAEAVIKTSSDGPMTLETVKGNEDGCKIKLKYGDAKEIPSEGKKQYANKYITCPISFLKDVGNFQMPEEGSSPEDLPGTYAGTLYFMMGWATTGYTGELDSGHPKEGGCTGTLVDYLQKKVEEEQKQQEEEREEERARATKGFACKDVTDVSYSKDLGMGEDISLSWGDPVSGNGYGKYVAKTDESDFWKDRSEEIGGGYYKNEDLKTIAITFSDDFSEGGIRDEYPSGVLTIECSNGKKIEAYLPGFTDVSGEGFETNSGSNFPGKFYVGEDGSTYFDIELTDLARSAE